jgi:hypothetical protein
MMPGQLLQACTERSVEPERYAVAGMILSCGTRSVGGQFEQFWNAGQLLRPVIELMLQGIAAQPAFLPLGVVGVLDGQVGQTGRLGRSCCSIHSRLRTGWRFWMMPMDQPSLTMWCMTMQRRCRLP